MVIEVEGGRTPSYTIELLDFYQIFHTVAPCFLLPLSVEYHPKFNLQYDALELREACTPMIRPITFGDNFHDDQDLDIDSYPDMTACDKVNWPISIIDRYKQYAGSLQQPKLTRYMLRKQCASPLSEYKQFVKYKRLPIWKASINTLRKYKIKPKQQALRLSHPKTGNDFEQELVDNPAVGNCFFKLKEDGPKRDKYFKARSVLETPDTLEAQENAANQNRGREFPTPRHLFSPPQLYNELLQQPDSMAKSSVSYNRVYLDLPETLLNQH